MSIIGRKKNTENKTENKKNFVVITKETVGMIFVLFSALCLICLITKDSVFGLLGGALSNLLLGLFGWGAYSVLIGIILGGIILIKGSGLNISLGNKIFITVSMIFFTLTLHAITIGDLGEMTYGKYLSTLYNMGENGFAKSSAGGLVIGLIDYPIASLITRIGTYAVYGVLFAFNVAFILTMKYKMSEHYHTPKTREKRSRTFPKGSFSEDREYPIDVPLPDLTEDGRDVNGLFYGQDDFKEVNKKKRTKEEQARFDLLYAGREGGLTVSEKTVIKPPEKDADKEKKLNYIKTPYEIIPNNKVSEKPKTAGRENIFSIPVEQIIRPTVQNQNSQQGNQVRQPQQASQIGNNRQDFAVPPRYAYNEGEQKEAPSFMRSENFTSNEIDAVEYTEGRNNAVTSNTNTRQRETAVNMGNENANVDGNAKFLSVSQDDVRQNTRSSFADRNIEVPRFNGNETDVAETESTRNFASSTQNEFDIKDDCVEDVVTFEEEKEELPPTNVNRGRAENISIFDQMEDGGDDEVIIPERATRSRSERTTRERSSRSSVSNVSQRSIFDFDEKKEEDFAEDTQVEEKVEERFVMPIHIPYNKPSTIILKSYPNLIENVQAEHAEKSKIIEDTLEQFDIPAKVENISSGPTVSRYELRMPAGISVKKVPNVVDDLSMNLCSKFGVIVEAPIPGKPLVGIQVENKVKTTVGLKEIIESQEFNNADPSKLMFAIGKDVVGNIVVDNLSKAPHMIVAGTTGSGKSCALDALIISLLYKYGPEELRLILVDPKQVGFAQYEHLPQLLFDEVITDVGMMIASLKWLVDEMERRYTAIKEAGCQDIDEYNKVIANEDTPKIPKIVLIADEVADFMDQRKKEIEPLVSRLTAKARASGINLVFATQRPSANVITGVIKANMPTRMGLKVSSATDSQVIHGIGGCEHLLGNGDMLYKNSVMSDMERIQGAYVTGAEIRSVVSYIIDNNKSYYDPSVLEQINRYAHPVQTAREDIIPAETEKKESRAEGLFDEAARYVIRIGSASASNLQAQYSIGYPTATRLMNLLTQKGIIAEFEGSRTKRVLMTIEEYESKFGSDSQETEG